VKKSIILIIYRIVLGAFFSAETLLDVCSVFGELTEEMTEKKKYEIYYSSRKSFHFSNCIVGTLLSIWQTLEIAIIYSTQQEKQIQLLRNSILKVCLRNLSDLNLITRCHENKLYFQCRGVQKGKRYTTEIPCWNCETNRLPRYYLKIGQR
jgi:hypothetical protein